MVNLTRGIQIITRFLPVTSTPPYSTVLPVFNPIRVTILCNTRFAASHLRFVDGGFRSGDEKKENKGDIMIPESWDPEFNLPWAESSLTQDLLLLENPIPFFVLQTLYDRS
ncbi:hypothetical protein M5689_022581 [Euphorbia peplus]|nr:hypothetical protein M5689_022581 [Euphorbia peplus]